MALDRGEKKANQDMAQGFVSTIVGLTVPEKEARKRLLLETTNRFDITLINLTYAEKNQLLHVLSSKKTNIKGQLINWKNGLRHAVAGKGPHTTSYNYRPDSPDNQVIGYEYRNIPQVTGLNYQKIPGDGSCLYRAVSYYTQHAQAELRNSVADYLAEDDNYKLFAEYIVLKKGQSKEQYINAIRHNEWGAQIEIKVLMEILQRPIFVIEPDGKIAIGQEDTGYNGKPIFVYFDGINHYDALTLTSEYENRSRDLIPLLRPSNHSPVVVTNPSRSNLNKQKKPKVGEKGKTCARDTMLRMLKDEPSGQSDEQLSGWMSKSENKPLQESFDKLFASKLQKYYDEGVQNGNENTARKETREEMYTALLANKQTLFAKSQAPIDNVDSDEEESSEVDFSFF